MIAFEPLSSGPKGAQPPQDEISYSALAVSDPEIDMSKNGHAWISCPGMLSKRGTVSFRATAEDLWRTARLLQVDRRGEKIMTEPGVAQ